MTPLEYANEWHQSALSFSYNGHYAWMAEQLGTAPLVLEVGCGAGISTWALAVSGRRVIALEENSDAVSLATDYLRKQGISVEVTTTDGVTGALPAQVCIVHANIFDQGVSEIFGQASYDAIVCWLIGGLPDRIGDHLGSSSAELTPDHMREYREAVHRRCFELGQNCLVPNGTVHIVDRMGLRSWRDKDEQRMQLAKYHRELAGGHYAVDKANTFFRRMTDTLNTSQIQYAATATPAASVITALASIKALRITT